MKRSTKLTISLTFLVFMMFASNISAAPAYVGIQVENKFNYSATVEYKINDTDTLQTTLSFSVVVDSVGSESGGQVPININITGSWSGDNTTDEPVNTLLSRMSGPGFEQEFDWSDTANLYEFFFDQMIILYNSQLFNQIIWFVSCSHGSSSDSYNFNGVTINRNWNENGVLTSHTFESIQEDETTGYYEREYVQVTLQGPDYTWVWVVSIAGVAVLAIVIIYYYRKKKKRI